MMKILYIPTGNIFTLPDEEAIKTQKADIDNYRIVDAGITEEKEPEKVTEEEVKELTKETPEEDLTVEEDTAPTGKIKQNPKRPKFDENTLALEKLSRAELVGICKRLGLHANKNEKLETLIQRIKESGKI